jgi:hypothetical protein
LEDVVDPSILSKVDFWNQEVNWKSIHELFAGACKNIELKVIRHGSSNLEINQSEAKVSAERAPFGFDLPVDPHDYPVVDYYGIPLNDEREVQKVLRDLRLDEVATIHQVIRLLYLSGI